MKKGIFLSFLFCLISCFGFAQSVTVDEARTVCDRFLQEKYPQASAKAPVFTLQESITDENDCVRLYRFTLNAPGFVIVSASKSTPPVLAYSFDQNFELIPPVEGLFHLYKNEIKFAENAKLAAKPKAAAAWQHYLSDDFTPALPKTTTVGPLLTTTWNQNKYYNTYCPWDVAAGAYYDYRVPNGCVALACSQIMNYHRYPRSGRGGTSYIPQGYPRQTVIFSQHQYHWDAMTDIPESYANEIAKIAYHVGVAIQMNYNYDGSGAQTSEAKEQLYETFGYDQSITSYYRGNYLDTVVALYIQILKDELNAHHPIYYAGCTSDFASCHAYVVDGYDDADRFHVNFGWGGFSNGFYALDNFVSGGSHFDYESEAILNIFPSRAVPDSYCEGLHRNTASFGYVADGSPTAKPYPANPDCSWMVAVPHAIDYTFEFDRLDLNPGIDYVTIYNGPSENSGVSGSFTGNTIPSESYTVSADSVLITFTSVNATAQNNTHLGFLLRYNTSLEPRSCNTITNLTDWHNIITDGTDDGDDYIAQTNCTWNVSLNYIAGFAFAFSKFDLGYGDFVDVYNNTTQPPILYKRFDIYNLPDGIYNVPFRKMKINFVADNWDQDDGFKLEYYAIAGVDEYSGIDDLSVYPNPATDKLNLSFSLAKSGNITCVLMDAMGKILKTEAHHSDAGENIFSMDVSGFAAGFYLLEIHTSKGKQIRKVMIG